MDFLIDTHAFLWFINGDRQLPERVVNIIENIENRCFISIASIWEIAIKISLGKLEIKGGFNTIEDFLKNNEFEILPIDFEDTKALLSLEFIHRDSFDRIIIAQAKNTNLTIITKDKQFKNYPVNIEW